MINLTESEWTELRSAVLEVTGDEDIVQEVFVSLLSRSETLTEVKNPVAWAMQAARYLIWSQRRMNQKTVSLEPFERSQDKTNLPEALIDYNTPEQQLLDREEAEYQARVIGSMPPKDNLTYLQRFIYKTKMQKRVAADRERELAV